MLGDITSVDHAEIARSHSRLNLCVTLASAIVFQCCVGEERILNKNGC